RPYGFGRHCRVGGNVDAAANTQCPYWPYRPVGRLRHQTMVCGDSRGRGRMGRETCPAEDGPHDRRMGDYGPVRPGFSGLYAADANSGGVIGIHALSAAGEVVVWL